MVGGFVPFAPNFRVGLVTSPGDGLITGQYLVVDHDDNRYLPQKDNRGPFIDLSKPIEDGTYEWYVITPRSHSLSGVVFHKDATKISLREILETFGLTDTSTLEQAINDHFASKSK